MDDGRKLANLVFWGCVIMLCMPLIIPIIFIVLGAYLNSCGVPA